MLFGFLAALLLAAPPAGAADQKPGQTHQRQTASKAAPRLSVATVEGRANVIVTATLIDYTYTPTAVAEPATLGLMGSALIGIAILGKKIRRKQ
jgi:PEP-CTERM motif